MWIDSHCHLDQLISPESSMEKAIQAKVNIICGVTENLNSMKKMLALYRKFPQNIYLAMGIHPVNVSKISSSEIQETFQYMKNHIQDIKMIGEIGLDFKVAKTLEEQEKQREVLEDHLSIGKEHGKPINLHSRWALRQVMEVAIEYRKSTGNNALLHWFTQSKKLIKICGEEKIYVSVGPTVLESEMTQDVVSKINLKYMLLETDSPVPFHGENAQPSWIPRVAEKVASLFGISLQSLEDQLEENFFSFLQ